MKCASCYTENPASQSFCGTCGSPLPFDNPEASDAATASENRPGFLAKGSLVAGRYLVVEELARGAMGRVYKAVDTRGQNEIALKVLLPELAADHEALERFAREMRRPMSITHRNVCRLFDLDRSDGVDYLTMELVPGEDVKHLVRRSGALSPGQVVRIGRQICDGLAEAHRLGVVHGDLTSQHIMVDEDGNAKILGFGISRSAGAAGITGHGLLVGTPQYMSPEQVDGEEIDPRTDVYSLGIVLYEMATGKLPFDGDTALAVTHKQRHQTPADPRTLKAQMPAALGALILKCIAKGRAARHQSAADIRAELDRIGQRLLATARPVPARRTSSTRITIPMGPRWLLAAAAVLVLAAAGLFLWHPWSRGVPVSPTSGKPTVAVTWFDNRSERPDLDRALVSLLTTNLSRDGALDVVSTQRMFLIQKQLGNEDAAAIDRTTAADIARRAGAGTMVTGSIRLGDQVRITAEMVRVRNGAIIATLEESGQRLDDLFPMVDRLTERIRTRLGMPEATPAQALRIADVSTTSLDAYQHYQKGLDSLLRWNTVAARKELEQAVAIDPAFAGAWVSLAQARVGPGAFANAFSDVSDAIEALQRARAHESRATEREKLQMGLLESAMGGDWPGVLMRSEALVAKFPDDWWGNIYLITTTWLGGTDLDRARTAAERYLEINPTDADTYNLLACVQSRQGDHQAASSTIKKYVALQPDVARVYDAAWEIHVQSGLFDEALAYADRYRQLRPEAYAPWQLRGETFLMRDDPERARQEYLSMSDGTLAPQVTRALDISHAYVAEGRFKEAERSLRKAVELAAAVRRTAPSGDGTGPAAMRNARFELGLVLAARGRAEEAIREFRAGEAASAAGVTGRRDPYAVASRYLIGVAHHWSGNQTEALKQADSVRGLVKQGGLNAALLDYSDLLVAEAAVSRGDKRALAAALARISVWHRQSSPVYWRLAAATSALNGDTAGAVAILERVRKDVALSRNMPASRLTYFYERSRIDYVAGRLYDRAGDAARALDHYRRYLRLMARADPGNPDIDDARTRLAAIDGRR
jgi:serine/threonine protein kinase/tetratricopeptide (TPR) repeat protein